MARYRLSREAERDLREIGRYTQRHWGAEQRRRYLYRLDRRLEFLVDNPKAGTARDDLREGFHSFPEGRHVIFYREAAGTIEVIRLLHDSMDVARRFRSEE